MIDPGLHINPTHYVERNPAALRAFVRIMLAVMILLSASVVWLQMTGRMARLVGWLTSRDGVQVVGVRHVTFGETLGRVDFEPSK